MSRQSKLIIAGILSCAVAAGACGDDAKTTSGSSNNTSSGGSGGNGGATNSGPGPGPTVGSGGAGGAGVGGAGGMEAPTGWVADPVPTLNNDAECLAWAAISPETFENGHLYGVRLTPPSYPYTVTEVVYELFHDGTDCTAAAAHHVEVYVTTETMPPNTPTGPVSIAMPAVTLENAGTRVVTAALPAPIMLQTGEHLVVAIEMVAGPADEDPKTCLATCENATILDRDWWSNVPMAPFDWQTLDFFGFQIHARVGANGS